MAFRGRHPWRRWAARLGALALLLQLAAGMLPMSASAGSATMPGWLAGSLCRGSDGAPAAPDHPVCPVCFVLSHAAGALPPAAAALQPPPPAAVPSDLRGSAVTGAAAGRNLSVRGPPAA